MKWYQMDCDAQDNLDMRKLVAEWGWEWYGRYYAILGKVGLLVTKKSQTFALQTNDGRPFPVRLLADDLGTTVQRLTDFLNYLSDNHLIDPKAWKTKSLIFCPKLRERADEYTKTLLENRKSLGRNSLESREQEREIEVKEKDSSNPPTPLRIPDALDTKEVAQALADFAGYRKETKHPLTLRASKLLLTNLLEFSRGDPATAVKILERSIVNGWRGIFELKDKKNGQVGSQAERAAHEISEQSVRNAETFVERIRATDRARDQRAGSDSIGTTKTGVSGQGDVGS